MYSGRELTPANANVGLFAVPSLIVSIQPFVITLFASSSGTATINRVLMPNAVIFHNRFLTDWTGGYDNTSFQPRFTFTNETTITVTCVGAATSGVTTVVKGTVVEFKPGVIKSIQRGSLSLNSGSTYGVVTLSPPVVTDKTWVMDLGMSTNQTNTDIIAHYALTNSTSVTIASNGSASTREYGYQVVEFF